MGLFELISSQSGRDLDCPDCDGVECGFWLFTMFSGDGCGVSSILDFDDGELGTTVEAAPPGDCDGGVSESGCNLRLDPLLDKRRKKELLESKRLLFPRGNIAPISRKKPKAEVVYSVARIWGNCEVGKAKNNKTGTRELLKEIFPKQNSNLETAQLSNQLPPNKIMV